MSASSLRSLDWVTSVVAAAGAVGLLLTRPAPPPQFAAVRAAWVPSDAWLLDRHGELLDSRRLDARVRRLEWTPLTAVSPALIDAVVEAEDRRFHAHRGVDWRASVGALRDAARGRRRGASTISMQTASLI